MRALYVIHMTSLYFVAVGIFSYILYLLGRKAMVENLWFWLVPIWLCLLAMGIIYFIALKIQWEKMRNIGYTTSKVKE